MPLLRQDIVWNPIHAIDIQLRRVSAFDCIGHFHKASSMDLERMHNETLHSLSLPTTLTRALRTSEVLALLMRDQ